MTYSGCSLMKIKKFKINIQDTVEKFIVLK